MRDIRVITLEDPPPVFDCSGGCGSQIESTGVYYVDSNGAIYCPFCRALFELSAHKVRPTYVTYH